MQCQHQIMNRRVYQTKMLRLREIEKRLREIEKLIVGLFAGHRLSMKFHSLLFRFTLLLLRREPKSERLLLREVEELLRKVEEQEQERGRLLRIVEEQRERLRCNNDQTKVYYRRWTRKREPNCDPSNRIIDIITQASTVVIIVAYDVQGGSSGPMKVEKGLTKKKTHKGAKGGRGRGRSISGGRDGEAIRDINSDCDPGPHIQKTGRPQVGCHFSQANGGVKGQDESWDGLEREKGSGGREGGSMGGSHEEEAVSDIKRGCHQTLHIETNRRPEVGFGVSQASGRVERRGESPDELKWESGSESTCGGRDQERGESGGSEFRDEEGEASGSVESRGRGGEGSRFGSECRDVQGEGSGSVESECRDAEGEGSRSGANQDRDGEGEGSSSGESQGQDRGEGSASGENQGGDRNAEGSRSSDDDDEDERERERQRRGRGDIEQGIQERNQEEIDFSGIPEAFMAIIGAVTIAVVDFHSNGAISSKILSLVIAINVFGFLCCMTSMLHRHRNPRAARIFGTIGVAAASLGLLLLVSLYFSSYYGWIILGLGSLAILVICVWAFKP
ncbi:hypothetical protein ACB094_04G022700 [Castanea mollissima]